MQLAILLTIVLAFSTAYLLRQWYTGELAYGPKEEPSRLELDTEAASTRAA